MRLISVDVRQSPDRAGYTRLCGEVSYDRQTLKPETYWFDVPDKFAPFLSDSGNPWLLCLAPVAITLGEPLRLSRAVDHTLLRGVHELMKVWSSWFPRLKPVAIEADVDVDREYPTASKTLSFFSGGVDAFFTALYHSETPDPHHQIPIDDLVNVWGFDIPISNTDAFSKIEDRFGRRPPCWAKSLSAWPPTSERPNFDIAIGNIFTMAPRSPAWPMSWKSDTARPSSPPAAAITKPSRTAFTRL